MEMCARNLSTVRHLAALKTLESTAETNDKRRMRSAYNVEDLDDEVICPKPRRPSNVSYPASDFLKPPRPRSHSSARTIGEPAFEILDIFLSKTACSPPYFCGSPPRRADNPLIRDVQFTHQRIPPVTMRSPQNTNFESARSVVPCVRVEGFVSGADTCCSVSALA